MNKKFLFAVIAATIMGNAWADDGRVLTTQTYVDNADALKQDKIPAGTAGQIVLYNGTDANGQTKFTGRQITTTLNATTNIPTSGAVLNYLANYQQNLKLNHAWTRAEMNDAPLPKMGLGDDELYLIPDAFDNGNKEAINFINGAGDNTTLTTDAVVYGLNKLAKAKQDVIRPRLKKVFVDDNTYIETRGTILVPDPNGIPDKLGLNGLLTSEVLAKSYEKYFENTYDCSGYYCTIGKFADWYAYLNGEAPGSLKQAFVTGDALGNALIGTLELSTALIDVSIPKSGYKDLDVAYKTTDWLDSSIKGTGIATRTSDFGHVGERKIIEESDVPNYQASSLSANEKEIQKISIPTMGAVMAAISNNTPNLPTGTAGNVVTYNTSGQIGGSVATYTGAATYNATNDANKIPTMSGVTAWAQAKKVCIRWLDTPEHPEHNDENCLLWELPD